MMGYRIKSYNVTSKVFQLKCVKLGGESYGGEGGDGIAQLPAHLGELLLGEAARKDDIIYFFVRAFVIRTNKHHCSYPCFCH
jgi:hypothetical protein